MPQTTGYSWVMPQPGGSGGSWGNELNALFQFIDTQVKAIDLRDANKLDLTTGGVVVGRVDMTSAALKIQALGASNTQTMDLAVANYFTLMNPVGVQLAIVHPASGYAQAVVVRVTNGNGQVSWPNGTKWGTSTNGLPPTLSGSGKSDLIVLVSDDSGNTWRGVVVDLNYG